MALKSITAALSLMLIQAAVPAGEATPAFFAELPAQVGAWKKAATAARYDCKTLYDYIDGGAELYLAFDFTDALAIEYAAGKNNVIKIDIFNMGSPKGAFGAFAHGRETVSAEVGQGSDYSNGLLTFWKHRWFVSVQAYPETPEKRKAVYKLGRAVAALIPDTGSLPPILAALPRLGLVESSVRTFHHHLLQNDYVFMSNENPLKIGPGTEAVLARYMRQDQRHVLMIVEYPSEGDAEKAHHGFMAGVLGNAETAMLDERWAGLKRSGKRVVIALDAPSKQAVIHILSEVP